MEDKVNYSLVGAFVLVLGAALVAGVLWLSAGVGTNRKLDVYQAYIEESVAGLDVDAPVKYLGVDVGKVSRIEIDPLNSRRVRLQFMLKAGTPVKQDSEAVLKAQGLTGIAYVELSGGSAGALPLLAGADGQPPTIPFKLSLGARLESVVGRVLGSVDRVAENINAVFDADNSAALKAALADVALLAKSLSAQRAVISQGLADAARMAQVGADAIGKLDPALQRVASGAQAVERMADVAAAASVRAGIAADGAAGTVQQLSSETLPEAARLISELGQLSTSLRALSEQTTRNPNSLVLGRPEPVPGPGEGKPK